MKKKKGTLGLGAIIGMFIGAIVVLALLPSISDRTEIMSSKMTVANESIDLTNARIDDGGINNTYTITVGKVYSTTGSGAWRSGLSDCYYGGFAMKNQTGDTLTVTTDYTFYQQNGTLFVENTEDTNHSMGNTSTMTYTYCAEGYITGAAGRSITNIIVIFAVIALLIFVIWGGIAKSGLIWR